MSDDLLDQLCEAHRQVFDGLLDAVDGLDDAGWGTPTGCPGWDVHDQLAHVVGIERAMLGDPADEVEVPDLPHVVNDFGRVVEVAVHARRGRPAAELVQEATETFDRRVAGLRALDPALLAEPMQGPPGMRFKGSQMLRTRLFDMTCHESDIRRALGKPGAQSGPHIDITVEQIVRAWARVLPDANDRDGVLGVVIEGRAPVRIDFGDGSIHRDGSGPEPTATIHLDVPGFFALGSGRTDAPTADELQIDGDRSWAEKVLQGAAITP